MAANYIYEYPPLRNEEVFEDFLVDLCNAKYGSKGFTRYKERGEAQFGVDVYCTTE